METRRSAKNADHGLLNFQRFIEEEDDLEQMIAKRSATVNSYSPDDLLVPKSTTTSGHTFIYHPQTDKLHLDKLSTRHANMPMQGGVNGRIRFPSEDSTDNFSYYKSQIPVIMIWSNEEQAVKMALKAIVRDFAKQPHIEESFVIVGGDYKGRLKHYVGTATKPSEKEQEIWIADSLHLPSQLPALLHTLPKNSEHYKQVANYICKSNLPSLRPFKARACGTAYSPKPRMDLRMRLARTIGD
jgi:hypothetical protein